MSKAKSPRRAFPVFLFVSVCLVLGLTGPHVLKLARAVAPGEDVSVAATRHTARLFETIPVHRDLGLVLRDGVLSLAGQDGIEKVNAVKAALDTGQAELLANGGHLTVFTRLGPSRRGRFLSPFARAIADGAFSRLTVLAGTLEMVLPHGRRVRIDEAEIVISPKGSGRVGLVANGTWRGFAVTLTIDQSQAAVAQNDRKGVPVLRSPVRMRFESDVLSASFNGTLAQRIAPTFEGRVNYAAPSLRRLMATTAGGALWVPDLNDFELAAQAIWNDQAVSFQDVRLGLDGQMATGALSVALDKQRPVMTGTLDFSQLDLGPLVASFSRHAFDPLDAQSWWLPLWSVLRFSLARAIDADVRVSAEDLRFATTPLGRLAASILLKDGLLKAHLAEFGLANGHGTGQLSVNLTKSNADINARGKISEIDLREVSRWAGLTTAVQGTSDLTFDLTTKGRSKHELRQRLVGTLALSGEPGEAELGLELARLADLKELSTLAKFTGPTAISGLAAEFAIFGGRLVCRSAKMRFDGRSVTLRGVVDPARDTVDVTASIASVEADAGKELVPGDVESATPSKVATKIRVVGPFANPKVMPVPDALKKPWAAGVSQSPAVRLPNQP